ncbi:DNA-binding response regulator [Ochrobactrum sp. P6BS-III]|jgi:two-component system OmpR family response regulator|uniref:response regulator n=1 Tax=unclassified Ochrobactrum TaxID=239106 RepID=UPI000991E938|nr:two-component system OmpR family response regulator [Ochrobactrum sp. P6BSIII]OOL20404.1 DNA-binding response regulator [Ochrobactrum sp. P6BS-III]
MSVPPHILIVDDDPEIRSLLSRYISEQGFRVSVAGDRRECEKRLTETNPNLIVLDVMLPDGSGLDICRRLRDREPSIPVILLTALKEDVDRIIGLEIGADDYLGKPFNPRELTARIKAVLRRSQHVASTTSDDVTIFHFGDFSLDPQLRKVVKQDGAQIELTAAEFDLLKVFVERPGRLLSRDQLLDFTQGRGRGPLDRSIDVLMSRLRRKLDDSQAGDIFKTVRNGGYQLTVPVKTSVVTR